MVYIGVDACKKGWFSVVLGEGTEWKVDISSDIFTFWNQYNHAKLILIDIPIGLRENESSERSCDKEARKLLGPKRGSSVFPVPCRDAVYVDAEQASERNRRITGRKLSKQVMAIIPKIKEVDQFLTSNGTVRKRIREIHPEVCFWALHSRSSMTFKKKGEMGIQERKEVLANVYPFTEEIYDYAERRYPRKQVSRDDILDALVAAVTASKENQGLLTIPEKPEIDSNGLHMEMVYYPLGPFR